MTGSSSKPVSGRSASAYCAATRSSPEVAATPASTSPLRSGEALASSVVRSGKTWRLDPIVALYMRRILQAIRRTLANVGWAKRSVPTRLGHRRRQLLVGTAHASVFDVATAENAP